MMDQLKAMQAMGALLKNKDKLQAAAARVKQATADLRAEGTAGAGAGAVRVIASGDGRVLDVRFDAAFAAGLADSAAREAAGRACAEAVNEALAAARQRVQLLVREEARSMGIPEVDQFLERAISSGGLGF